MPTDKDIVGYWLGNTNLITEKPTIQTHYEV